MSIDRATSADTLDDVDRIVSAWRRERPDLDVTPLEILSRVSRLARRLDLARGAAFAERELETWEFDVLSALRRAGAPYELSPGQLVLETLVTSGTMTNRVDRLTRRGFVERNPSPTDAASWSASPPPGWPSSTARSRNCSPGSATCSPSSLPTSSRPWPASSGGCSTRSRADPRHAAGSEPVLPAASAGPSTMLPLGSREALARITIRCRVRPGDWSIFGATGHRPLRRPVDHPGDPSTSISRRSRRPRATPARARPARRRSRAAARSGPGPWRGRWPTRPSRHGSGPRARRAGPAASPPAPSPCALRALPPPTARPHQQSGGAECQPADDCAGC